MVSDLHKNAHCVLKSRVLPGADVSLDHQLVLANFSLKLKTRRACEKARKFDVRKLSDTEIASTYTVQISVNQI